MVTSLLHELQVSRAALASMNLVVHRSDSMHNYDEDELLPREMLSVRAALAFKILVVHMALTCAIQRL